ncbi:ABC transporter permease subunit [Sulfitobacter mediterraneus]|uniref:Spermidine/putrescine transport system permease protein n=1 Tax=Sulfitobacter mediterraneus TaxID=83219 RepID=A0A2T6CFE2_9RHOB|nr:ABC transporter permease subunit [Sulfitobacter mediterraneus]KIN77793.1 Binding-protein-dependent transport systems inner membrane component [Sulfitobacter mediterraneus KCTC 32188]MBM1555935.1 ABC transporter permease subunit [Sulfitobacter mediterraneus]MBM1568027.1 ABC transporter permease subunit [Sulfitobacter mediterraneus]MBM1571289.1 ABC transporter permease subunit [Sulfitobacter mediterraneus]MBM1575077.1 ABC transporter permease subunit [Sulfitobacter mediterraneus]
MITGIPQSSGFKWTYRAYVTLFFVYLALPLITVCVFAFNDSVFPSLPWDGFTWDWFFGTEAPRLGVFHERPILRSIGTSAFVAVWVSGLAVLVGTCNAFLFVRHDFAGKDFLYILMLLPLIIPGIILGISILVFSSSIANTLEEATGLWFDGLRPGLILVILGQFSFITTFATLVISARLQKFDTSLEEAALNLGATKWGAIRQVTLPFLLPAMIAAAVVAVLMSFENFNTTLMLVGSDAPLTVTMFDRLKQGSTPVLNAVSLLLIVVSAILGLASLLSRR